jgi:hypothetical protein
MDPNEKTTEQEFNMILDIFLSDDKSMQDENVQVEYSCWDDEFDNCNGDKKDNILKRSLSKLR